MGGKITGLPPLAKALAHGQKDFDNDDRPDDFIRQSKL
jgi:hypothetical protein